METLNALRIWLALPFALAGSLFLWVGKLVAGRQNASAVVAGVRHKLSA